MKKGATTSDSKYKSLNGRWFSQKGKKIGSENGTGDLDDVLYIERDSLIQLKCTRGKSISLESYRVLVFFCEKIQQVVPPFGREVCVGK